MVLASSLTDTLGLVVVFFVVFPAVVTAVIGVAIVQTIGERRANERYRNRRSDQPD